MFITSTLSTLNNIAILMIILSNLNIHRTNGIEVSSNAAAAIKQNPDGHKQTYISSESKAKTTNSLSNNHHDASDFNPYNKNPYSNFNNNNSDNNYNNINNNNQNNNINSDNQNGHINRYNDYTNKFSDADNNKIKASADSVSTVPKPSQLIDNLSPLTMSPVGIERNENKDSTLNINKKLESENKDYFLHTGTEGSLDDLKSNKWKYDHDDVESVQHERDYTWGYSDSSETYGIEKWNDYWPTCSNALQSPINIDSEHAIDRTPNMTKLKFETYSEDGTIHGDFHNTGNGIGFSLNHNKTRVLATGGPLFDDIYSLEQFHFHTGCDVVDQIRMGSEHSINGKLYPGEVHFIFRNIKSKDFPESTMDPKGAAVIAIFLQISDEPTFNLIQNLNHIMDRLNEPHTKYGKMSGFDINLFGLKNFLQQPYYFYKGSLTTPPCTGGVTWIVMTEPIKISKYKLELFTKPTGFNRGKVCDNKRPIKNSDNVLVYHCSNNN